MRTDWTPDQISATEPRTFIVKLKGSSLRWNVPAASKTDAREKMAEHYRLKGLKTLESDFTVVGMKR